MGWTLPPRGASTVHASACLLTLHCPRADSPATISWQYFQLPVVANFVVSGGRGKCRLVVLDARRCELQEQFGTTWQHVCDRWPRACCSLLAVATSHAVVHTVFYQYLRGVGVSAAAPPTGVRRCAGWRRVSLAPDALAVCAAPRSQQLFCFTSAHAVCPACES